MPATETTAMKIQKAMATAAMAGWCMDWDLRSGFEGTGVRCLRRGVWMRFGAWVRNKFCVRRVIQ
jgi:hypothetical protein